MNSDHDSSPSRVLVAERAANPESSTGQCVSPRRMKKRELDRKCQRMARDRTKNHIAHLEKLVEDFRQQDTNRHIAVLMGQLSDLRKERDALARSLDSIAKLAKGSRTSERGGGQGHEIDESVKSGRQDSQSTHRPTSPNTYQSFAQSNSTQNDIPLNTVGSQQTEEPSQANTTIPGDVEMLFEPVQPNQNGCLILGASPIDASPSIYDGTFESTTYNATITNSQPWDPIIPRTQTVCECSITTQVVVGYKRKNLWRFANEVLTVAAMEKSMTPATQTRQSSLTVTSLTKQRFKEDIPIRAILYGWDTVADLVDLSPTWQALRRIDEQLFAPCAKVERLGIMCMMYLQLESYADPIPEKSIGLPTWYIRRPSQSTIAHSYAIDFFSWPGVRERFVFSQHRYCSNIFWDLFCTSFRLLWPYELRDCYARNTHTGIYKISSTFNERLRNIQSWAMGPEMFERFPEFYSDIPTFNHIPGVISENAWPHTEAPIAEQGTGRDVGDDECIAPDVSQQDFHFFSLDSSTTFSHSYMQQTGPATGTHFKATGNLNAIEFDGSTVPSF